MFFMYLIIKCLFFLYVFRKEITDSIAMDKSGFLFLDKSTEIRLLIQIADKFELNGIPIGSNSIEKCNYIYNFPIHLEPNGTLCVVTN